MSTQNELSQTYQLGIDIRPRVAEIVAAARQELNFEPDANGLLGFSTWWNSERAGAFRYAGSHLGQPAILKAQGIKPEISEITALQGFAAANHSTQVRPPELYASLPWDEQRAFELLVVEKIDSAKLISYPTNSRELEIFFRLFADYRENCRSHPWIPKPKSSIAQDFRQAIAANLQTASELYPHYPHRKRSDFDLIERGTRLLERFWNQAEPEFQHLHITSDDVFLPNGDDPRHIYTSNFVWGWKAPFFDATAAYHHYPRLLCERALNIDVAMLRQQTDLWEAHMTHLAGSREQKTQLSHMLLGQLLGCLTISDLMIDPAHPMAQALIEQTREKIMAMMTKLS